MKKLILFLTLILAIFPSTVSAHLAGQPPYFMVDGVYSNLYYVPLTSLENFDLPQDQSPRNYLVGEQLNFKIDRNQLPVPSDIIDKTKFYWHFGDGTNGMGLSNSHVYKKMGSYILSIYVDDGTVPTPQILESVMIQVLPNKNYQLPKAVIQANGKISSDPLTDITEVNFKYPVFLDASKSTDPESKIVSYFWDLGDVTSSNSEQVSHLYQGGNDQLFAVLRVKDQNGFISDNFVELQSNTSAKPFTPPKTASSSSFPYWIIGVVIIAGATGFFIFKKS